MEGVGTLAHSSDAIANPLPRRYQFEHPPLDTRSLLTPWPSFMPLLPSCRLRWCPRPLDGDRGCPTDNGDGVGEYANW